jgi:hypothetical protein
MQEDTLRRRSQIVEGTCYKYFGPDAVGYNVHRLADCLDQQNPTPSTPEAPVPTITAPGGQRVDEQAAKELRERAKQFVQDNPVAEEKDGEIKQSD